MKIIAIYADSVNGKVGQTTAYMNFVSHFGIPRLITPSDNPKEIVDTCDVLLIPGGADVSPLRYNEPPHPATGRSNAHYEFMDMTVAQEFINAKKPIIGICRGMQSLNVMFGGTLHQHIIGHQQSKEDREATNQVMKVESGKEFNINTIHHQAVKKLGEGLVAIGHTAIKKGCNSLQEPEELVIKRFKKGGDMLSIVEAFHHEILPIVAFQYHPEEFNCPFAINQITNLIGVKTPSKEVVGA